MRLQPVAADSDGQWPALIRDAQTRLVVFAAVADGSAVLFAIYGVCSWRALLACVDCLL